MFVIYQVRGARLIFKDLKNLNSAQSRYSKRTKRRQKLVYYNNTTKVFYLRYSHP